MRKWIYAVLAVCFLSACAGSKSQINKDETLPGSDLVKVTSLMIKAYEKQDAEEFLGYVSEDFRPQNKTELKQNIQQTFDQSNRIDVLYVLERVQESAASSNTLVKVNWHKSRYIKGVKPARATEGSVELIFNKNNQLEEQKGDVLFD